MLQFLGNVLPWRWLAVAAMALPALLFIFSFSLLETPRFLMLQHHPEKAKENLQRLRGRDVRKRFVPAITFVRHLFDICSFVRSCISSSFVLANAIAFVRHVAFKLPPKCTHEFTLSLFISR